MSVFCSEVIPVALSDIRGHDHEARSFVLNLISFHQLVVMSLSVIDLALVIQKLNISCT